jgi:hypothetical protein
MSYKKLEPLPIQDTPAGEIESAFARAKAAGWFLVRVQGKPAYFCPPKNIRSSPTQARIELVWGEQLILPSVFYEIYMPSRRMKPVVRVLLGMVI